MRCHGARRSCSRRVRCTGKSSGSAASQPPQASTQLRLSACCASWSGRTSSGANVAQLWQATLSTGSSTCCSATSPTGRFHDAHERRSIVAPASGSKPWGGRRTTPSCSPITTRRRSASRARAEALTNQSGFHMLAGRFEESIRVGAEARPLVETLGMEDQRARLHIVVGCARCCLGDRGGLDEIESGIAVAEAAGALEMLVIGYTNLSSELHFFARLAEARRAWRRHAELSDRYGLGRQVRNARADGAGWAYLDGRWDEAIRVADELISATDAGDRSFTDATVLSLRAWF